MLKCIPALSDFPNVLDTEYQENLLAAAVILRQCEELEEDNEAGSNIETLSDSESHTLQHLNFLHIIQAIIESTGSSSSCSSLANAVSWMALRQEIFHSWKRERPPLLNFGLKQRQDACPANKLIVHAADVMNWRWGDKSPLEWGKWVKPFVRSPPANTPNNRQA